MADPISEQTGRQIAKGLEDLARRMGSPGGSGRRSSLNNTPEERADAKIRSDMQKNQKKAISSLVTYSKHLKDMNALYTKMSKVTKEDIDKRTDTAKALDEFNDALKKSAKAYGILEDVVDDLTKKTIPHQIFHLNALGKRASELGSGLGMAQRKASLLSASLISTHDNIEKHSIAYTDMIEELVRASKNIPESYLKQANLIDETTGQMRDNLSADDFAKVRIAMGHAEEVIAKAGLAPGSLAAIASGQNARGKDNGAEFEKSVDALKNAAILLEKAGFSLGLNLKFDERGALTSDSAVRVNALKGDELKQLATSVGDLNKNVTISGARFDMIAVKSASIIGAFTKMYPQLASFKGMIGHFADSAIILKSLGNAWEGLKGINADLQKFNIAEVAASFKDVQVMSIKMGMSFEETTKFLQENGRTLAIYGSNAFSQLSGQLGATFKGFGFNLKQSAELVGPAIESAIESSVNVRNANALNNFIDDSMKSFQRVAAVTGKTAAEYFKLNSELASNVDVTSMSIGMGQEQANLYVRSLQSQRDELTLRGISIDQAQEIIKQQEAAKREKQETRFDEAAKIIQQAASLGVSATDAMRAYQITLKGQGATTEESKWRTGFLQQLGVAQQQRVQGALGTNLMYGLGVEAQAEAFTPGGAAGGLEQSGIELEKRQRAGAGLTAAEADQAASTSKGSAAIATLGNAANTVSSIMDNNLIKSALNLGAGFAGLMIQSGMLASVFSRTAMAAGAAGGLGGGLGKGIKGGLGLGAVGMVAGLAGSALTDAGHEQLGAGASALGDAATGAALGSLLLPGIGTAIGGALGAGWGLYSNWNALTGSTAAAGMPDGKAPPGIGGPGGDVNSAAPVVANAIDDGKMHVHDETAQGYLSSIATDMAMAVQILQRIASVSGAPGSPATSAGLPAIPSSLGASQGRG
jgi:hypothetical protein